MPENSQPPSHIRIRTLKNDIEEFRQSGGSGANRVLGKTLEELAGQPEKINPLFSEKEISEAVIASEQSGKKTKIFPILAIGLVIFILGAASVYFLLKPKTDAPQPTASVPTIKEPKYKSVFQRDISKKFVVFDGKISSWEKIISQAIQENSEPNSIKEIAFMKNEIDPFPADELMKILYSGFPGISLADLPRFKNFSLVVFSSKDRAHIGYASEIDETDLSSFASNALKSRFSSAFEKMAENHPDIFSSQFLENPGSSQKPFLSQIFGPVNGRYLRFSTGSIFYSAIYQNKFLGATSKEVFEKLVEINLLAQ